MSIQELTAVVKPPEHPFETGPVSRWDAIQKQLGTRLPQDFCDFGLTFGTGRFLNQGIEIANPFAATFPEWLETLCDVYRSLKEGEGDREVPFSVFPDTPGLLPWGADNQRGCMFWLTEGEPQNWPIMVYHGAYAEDASQAPFIRFDMEMTTFFAKIVKQEISIPELWLPDAFEDRDSVVFTPQDIKPSDQDKLKTVYQLYMDNGMQVGFWIHHHVWHAPGDDFRVVSVNNKKQGALLGVPPNYDGGEVFVDVYYDGILHEKNVQLRCPEDPGYQLLRTPEWWKGD